MKTLQEINNSDRFRFRLRIVDTSKPNGVFILKKTINLDFERPISDMNKYRNLN